MEKYKIIRDESLVEMPAVNFISTHLRSGQVPWFYIGYTVADIDIFHHHSLAHMFVVKDNWFYVHNLMGPNKPESHVDNQILNAINSLGVVPEFKTHKLTRAQVNCVHQTQSIQITPPHRDFDNPGCVYIYYVNDSDGDTIVYDEEGNVEAMVTPKAGHMVRMDSRQYHSSTTPVRTERRFVINLNFEET